ncbi:hypothetical protein OROGR_001695 [Orobanche gracilis]
MGIPVGAALSFKMQRTPPRTSGGHKVQDEKGAEDAEIHFALKQIAERDFSLRISALDIYSKRVKDILNHETDLFELMDGPEPIPSTSRMDKRSLTQTRPGRKDKRAKKDTSRTDKRSLTETQPGRNDKGAKKDKSAKKDKRREQKRQKKEKKDIDNSKMLRIVKRTLQELTSILPRYGFTEMTILSDTDESHLDPTKDNIENEVESFITGDLGDVLFLYYHGHTTIKPLRGQKYKGMYELAVVLLLYAHGNIKRAHCRDHQL